jgi:hypothetical protein
MTLVNNDIIIPRHEGYDIVPICRRCGYSKDHLEFGGLWPEEIEAIRKSREEIEKGNYRIYQSAEEFLKELKELEELE